MVNGRGGRRVRDDDIRLAAQARARADEHIPADEWEPPAAYAAHRRTWFNERYEQVRDPVLGEALRRHAQSIRILNRVMADEGLSRNELVARSGVSPAGAGQVFRGEVWPRVTVMLRLCVAAGQSFGAGQQIVPPDRIDPVVWSLRDSLRIAGMTLTEFANAAEVPPDALLRVILGAQHIKAETAGRLACALADAEHPGQTTLDL